MEGVGDVAVGAERDQDHEPQPEGHQRQPCRAVLSDAVFALQNNFSRGDCSMDLRIHNCLTHTCEYYAQW